MSLDLNQKSGPSKKKKCNPDDFLDEVLILTMLTHCESEKQSRPKSSLKQQTGVTAHQAHVCCLAIPFLVSRPLCDHISLDNLVLLASFISFSESEKALETSTISHK